MAEGLEHRVVLNVGDIRVDAEPGSIVTLVHSLIHNEEYRKAFETDPVGCLKDCGIDVPEEMRDRITPESIRATIDQLTEGSEAQLFVAPGVAPAIRVGTRPGTRPGVSVGVRVATGTSTFAAAEEPELHKVWQEGLVARQKAQDYKRRNRDDNEK